MVGKRLRAVQHANRKATWNADAPSDRDICCALVEGQEWAADALYDRVAFAIDAVLYRVLGNRDTERDDLAQQAIERVISSILSGRFEQNCSLSTWARLVTQNLAIDAMRSRLRERRFLDRSVDSETLRKCADDLRPVDWLVDARRRAEWLMGALLSINPDRTETFVLHDIVGHELSEIATLKNITVAAAQSRLVRGRRDVLRFISGRERQ